MEMLLQDVNWIAVVVGAVASFTLGWLWYSPTVFGTKWARGVGINISDGTGPMGMAMVAQVVSTLLLAWIIGVTEALDSLALAVLIAVTVAAVVKANGLYVQKNTYAIAVEVGYILAMVAVMVGVHVLL